VDVCNIDYVMDGSNIRRDNEFVMNVTSDFLLRGFDATDILIDCTNVIKMLRSQLNLGCEIKRFRLALVLQ